MKLLPHIASRVLGTPLLVGQAKLEAILSALGPRIGIETQPFGLPAEPRRRRAYPVTPEGVALIPVLGTLVRRAGPIEAASGLTSYGELETEILDAATDPAVRAILLDVDSPGGEAAGVFDLADLVFVARSLKPVWAVANEEAFSGAYAIASAAERMLVPWPVRENAAEPLDPRMMSSDAQRRPCRGPPAARHGSCPDRLNRFESSR